MHSLVLGIDVGGTNIKAGLVDASGRVFARTNLSTKSFIQSKEKLIAAVVTCVKDMLAVNQLARKDIAGVGVGLPGLIDTQKGIVNFLVNIPGWRNVPLKKILQEKLALPVFIDNDANVIALGEWKFGAGRGIKNLISITLGTGVGGGLIINNELFRGAGFAAGEIGHIPLNENGPKCNCGGYGCLETYIGNRYLLSKARKVFRSDSISLEEITRLADRGNRQAVAFWREVAAHLGNGLVGAVNLLNPQRIIIGGGIANAHRYLFKTICETIKKRAMKIQAGNLKIVKAQLGVNAGIVGTQVLVTHGLFSK